jgi:signal transduction histidine kinase/CheY-like chemotaxis protein
MRAFGFIFGLAIALLAARAAFATDYTRASADFKAALAKPIERTPVGLKRLLQLGRNASEFDPDGTLELILDTPSLSAEDTDVLLLGNLLKINAMVRARRYIEARALVESLPDDGALRGHPLEFDARLARVVVAQFSGALDVAQREVADLMLRLDAAPQRDPAIEFRVQMNLTSISARLGRFDEARRSGMEALAQARAMRDPLLEARALLNLGQLETASNHHEAAKALIDQAEPMIEALPPGDLSINLDLARAVVSNNLRDANGGRAALKRALAAARAQGNRYYEAFALSAQAQQLFLAGASAEAAELYAQAETLFANAELPDDAARLARVVSEALEKAGDLKGALEAQRRAETHRQKLLDLQHSAAAMALKRTLLLRDTERAVEAARLTAERDRAAADAAALKAQLAITAALLTATIAAALGLWVFGLRRRNEAYRELDRARSELLARAAHEIRNPLSAIRGLLELALSRTQRENLKEVLEPAHAAASALIDTTQDYLDHSRLSLGQLRRRDEPFDLSQLIHQVAALYRDQAARAGLELSVSTRLLESPRWVRSDSHKLRQILSNLLGNAVKFAGHGRVRLGAEELTPGVFVMFVEDDGPGIATALRERIFRPFDRADADQKKAGVGLGLSVADQLATLLGGVLKLDTPRERGARFSFSVTLPIEAPPAAESLPPPRSHLAASARPVLIVDDDPHVRLMLKLQLESLNATVVEAESVDAGFAQWQTTQPRLLLIDYHLGTEQGTALIERIRNAGDRHTPTVVLSASLARSSAIEHDLPWLAKPLSLDALKALLAGEPIERLLNGVPNYSAAST